MIEKRCEECGKTFRVPPSQSAARFCGHECYWSNKGTLKCKRNADGMYEKHCQDCGVLIITATWTPGTRCRYCAAKQARKTSPAPKGKHSRAWKGGRRTDSYGYIKIHAPGHRFADSTNYVREHIAVAVELVGEDKFREMGGAVHHINGIKSDNRPENLWICHNKENVALNGKLLEIAFRLVQAGYIVFDQGQYYCPLLGDKEGEARQIR